jgi:hypothetical protein
VRGRAHGRARRGPGVPARGVVLGVAVLALCGAACGRNVPDTLAPQLTSWVHSTQFGQTVGTLNHDNAEVTRALETHQDTLLIHTVCAVLETDAGTAEGTLPTPDSEVTDFLNTAFTTYYQAAVNCYDAGAVEPRLQARASAERAAATVAMVHGLIRIEALLNKTVSTSTTTTPDSGGIFG